MEKKDQVKKSEIAKDLFTDVLDFDEVLVFTALAKSQVIEQLRVLKYLSFSFF